MKCTICAIIKDEQQYLEEWIIHNLNIGFYDIHLYEDFGSTSHKDITDKYENVHLHQYKEVQYTSETGTHQYNLFQWFVMQYKEQYDWCAYIDIDEYIEFDDGYNLDMLCNEFKCYSSVYLCWKMYGANGHIKKPDGDVQENYRTKEHIPFNEPYAYKSFVNFHSNRIVVYSVHKICSGVFTNYDNKWPVKPVIYEKAWINHYFTKSWEEWLWRFKVRGDVTPGNRQIEEFFILNPELRTICTLNDIE